MKVNVIEHKYLSDFYEVMGEIKKLKEEIALLPSYYETFRAKDLKTNWHGATLDKMVRLGVLECVGRKTELVQIKDYRNKFLVLVDSSGNEYQHPNLSRLPKWETYKIVEKFHTTSVERDYQIYRLKEFSLTEKVDEILHEIAFNLRRYV